MEEDWGRDEERDSTGHRPVSHRGMTSSKKSCFLSRRNSGNFRRGQAVGLEFRVDRPDTVNAKGLSASPQMLEALWSNVE